MRIFKNDTDGSAILLGEDRINHTPKDEELSLTVGNAFDIVAEEVTLDRRALSQKVSEYDYRITLRNHKDEAVDVIVSRMLGVNWTILSSSLDYEKVSAQEVRFVVPVPTDGETALDFTVRYSN